MFTVTVNDYAWSFVLKALMNPAAVSHPYYPKQRAIGLQILG